MASMALTDSMFKLATRTVQLATQAPGILSVLEAETLYLVVDRGLDFGPEARVTAEEWAMITDVHCALVKHLADEVPA